MRPSEILDAQADLLGRMGDPGFDSLVTGMAAHHLGRVPASNRVDRTLEIIDTKESQEAVHQFRAIPKILANHVRTAAAYRVTHDMSQMVEWMASQLEDTDAFYRVLMPTECGIVGFDRPLPVQDIRGKHMLIHWIVWGPGEYIDKRTMKKSSGTFFWHFNDTWRKPDDVQVFFQNKMRSEDPEGWERYERIAGRWATVGMDLVGDGHRMGPPSWAPSEEQAAEVVADGDTPTPGTNAVRYSQALFLLLNQTVTSLVEEEPERAARRRSTKKGLPPKVTVIRLRREEQVGERPEGESDVQWQHRWIVRRHWRWQPYGPRKVDHEHVYGPIEPAPGSLVQRCVYEGCEAHLRRIVINPYVKGPEGAPLVQSEKVYDLAR